MKFTYRIEEYDFEHETSAPLTPTYISAMAEHAAEDYFSCRDGWESSWPLEFEILIKGVSKGFFEVELENVPTFSSTKVKKGKAQ